MRGESTRVRVECTGYHGIRKKYRLSVRDESTPVTVECTGYHGKIQEY